MTQAQGIFSALGWSGLGGLSGNVNSTISISQSVIDAITNNGGTLDYAGILNESYRTASAGQVNFPSVCDTLGYNSLIVCDPGRTGSQKWFCVLHPDSVE